jgi:hypothetical protein
MDLYPMDDIRDKTNSEIHHSMKNISMKVAVGMDVRFELAMLASGWMKLYLDMTPWSLTSQDLKRR